MNRSSILRALLAAAAITLGACASPTAPAATSSLKAAPGTRSNSGYVLASCDTDSSGTSSEALLP